MADDTESLRQRIDDLGRRIGTLRAKKNRSKEEEAELLDLMNQERAALFAWGGKNRSAAGPSMIGGPEQSQSTSQPAPASPPPDVEPPRPMPRAASAPVMPSSSPATATEGGSEAQPPTQPSGGGNEAPRGFWNDLKETFGFVSSTAARKLSGDSSRSLDVPLRTEEERATRVWDEEARGWESTSQKVGSDSSDYTHIVGEDGRPAGKAPGVGAASGGAVGLAIDLIAMKFQQAGEGYGQVAGVAGKMVNAKGPGDVVSGIGSGIEGLDKAWFGMVPGLGIVGKFVSALGDAVTAVVKWSDSVHDSNQEFAQFSGSMAGVMAQSRARDILLSQERGERRAAAAESLEQARFQRQQSQSAVADAFHNKILAPALEKSERMLNSDLERIAKLFGIDLKNEDMEGQSFEEWGASINDPTFFATYERLPVFKQGRDLWGRRVT